MNVGTAQLDITPRPGLDLAGFAVRPQPSTSVLDPLHVRALYLEHGSEKLLWLNADLLAFEQPFADRFRQWVQTNLGIASSRVLLSATHTHSAPAAIRLVGCGEVDRAYVGWLEGQMQQAAQLALRQPEPCYWVQAEGECSLGQDRRQSPSAHNDSRVGAFGWRRADGTFKAVGLNYTMHPVCLRSSLISADWPGAAARVLTDGLPGEPITLVSVGACANINPPQVGVAADQMRRWGEQIAESVRPALLKAPQVLTGSGGLLLGAAHAKVDLPQEMWNTDEIDRYADVCLANPSGCREFGDKFRLAVDSWRSTMKNHLRKGKSLTPQAELIAIALGRSTLLGVNAEVFSRFTERVSTAAEGRVYTVSCANGMIGYLPTAEAYDEGGYEVDWAMMFYNLPRVKKGGLDLLVQHACRLVAACRSQSSE